MKWVCSTVLMFSLFGCGQEIKREIRGKYEECVRDNDSAKASYVTCTSQYLGPSPLSCMEIVTETYCSTNLVKK